MLKKIFENFALKGTDWLFRARSTEAILIKSACGLLIAIYGGPPLIALILYVVLGSVPEGFLTVQRALDLVDGWLLGICSLLVAVSIFLIIRKSNAEAKNRDRKRVVVIEGRGLRDDDGSPLEQAVSKTVDGKIIPILLDLRNRMDGKVIAPARALEDIAAVHRSLLQLKAADRCNLTTVYGGLTSVPYTFLTGVLLDDEGSIITYDWDRVQEEWRKLEGPDDGAAFVVDGINDIAGADEVVIALAFSYAVETKNLTSTFSYPFVRLTLEGMSSDAHWSQAKQNRLAQQFFEVVKQLSARGVRRIHLVMAAPNSAVFTFGRRYDKRNLPELVVYQFERGADPAYPWGVLMPVAGVDRPQIHKIGNAGDSVSMQGLQ